MKWLRIIIVVAALAVGLSATADTTQPRIQIGEAWGITIQNGGSTDVSASVPATLFGIGAATPINNSWNLVGDVVIAVPHTKFYPGIRPVIGLVRKFNGWSLTGTLMYQWNPPYANSEATHLIGTTFGPSFPLASGGSSFSFGMGYRAQFTEDKIFHILAIGPTIMFFF